MIMPACAAPSSLSPEHDTKSSPAETEAGVVSSPPRTKMSSGNSAEVEQALGEHAVDLGLVESLSRRQGLHYTLFAPDELVLVARTGGPYARTDAVTPDRLRQIPLVLRLSLIHI